MANKDEAGCGCALAATAAVMTTFPILWPSEKAHVSVKERITFLTLDALKIIGPALLALNGDLVQAISIFIGATAVENLLVYLLYSKRNDILARLWSCVS